MRDRETIRFRQMDQPSGSDNGDDAGAHRDAVIDENDIGALSFAQRTAIVQSGRAGRCAGNQVPRLGQREYAISGETERRDERRRIVII